MPTFLSSSLKWKVRLQTRDRELVSSSCCIAQVWQRNPARTLLNMDCRLASVNLRHMCCRVPDFDYFLAASAARYCEKIAVIKSAASAASTQGGCASSRLDHGLKFYVIQGGCASSRLISGFSDCVGLGLGVCGITVSLPFALRLACLFEFSQKEQDSQ